jgi:hypothetical protein
MSQIATPSVKVLQYLFKPKNILKIPKRLPEAASQITDIEMVKEQTLKWSNE